MKTVRGRVLPLAAVSALALGVAACGGSPEGGEADEQYADLEAELSASGASFPDAYYQAVIEEFGAAAPGVVINYEATGSGTGKQQFADNLNDFAGTDSLVDEEEDGIAADDFYYLPTVAAPITVTYNLPEVDELQLSPDTIAGIYQGDIENWNDEAIAEDNPDTELPDTAITIAHRSDGSGTTSNFTEYLDEASEEWDLGSGDTVEWPSGAQGGEKNTGVAQLVQQSEGAIGYVDLADAEETDLSYAAVENAVGEFVAPTLDGTTAALEGAEVNDDLSYSPLNADGEEAYPISAPTYLLLRASYEDPEKGEAVKAFAEYLLTDGQDMAEEVNFAKLPDELREQAIEQLENVEG